MEPGTCVIPMAAWLKEEINNASGSLYEDREIIGVVFPGKQQDRILVKFITSDSGYTEAWYVDEDDVESVPTPEDDTRFISEVAQITDARRMLEFILDHEEYLGDRYYRDLRNVMIEHAQDILYGTAKTS